MIICEKCGFEAKNKNGLRLHSRKHKNEPTPEEAYSEANLPFARIKLYDKEKNQLIVSYVVEGKEEIEKAKAHAEKKNLRIEII
jgi:hypothetical protein